MSWQQHGSCVGHARVFDQDEYLAKRLCRACPVQPECLAHALEHNETGLWGGLNDTERANVRHGRRLAVEVPDQVLRDRRRYACGDRDPAAVAANAAYSRAFAQARGSWMAARVKQVSA